MAKVIVVLAASSEVEDFYEQFDADVMKRTMGWEYSFKLCDPDTERPGRTECAQIMKVSGLTERIIGDFSHFLGEFILNAFIDHENYDLPKDFVAYICSDDADREKLIVFSTLKGVNVTIYEIKSTEENLRYLYELFERFLSETISAEQVFKKLGWKDAA